MSDSFSQQVSKTIRLFENNETYFIYPDIDTRKRMYIPYYLGDAALEAMGILDNTSAPDRDLMNRLIEVSQDVIEADGKDLDEEIQNREKLADRQNRLESILRKKGSRQRIDRQG